VEMLRIHYRPIWLRNLNILLKFECVNDFIDTFLLVQEQEQAPASLQILWSKFCKDLDLTRLLRLEAYSRRLSIEIVPHHAFEALTRDGIIPCKTFLDNASRTQKSAWHTCAHTDCQGIAPSSMHRPTPNEYQSLVQHDWCPGKTQIAYLDVIKNFLTNKNKEWLQVVYNEDIEVQATFPYDEDEILIHITCNETVWGRIAEPYTEGVANRMKAWALLDVLFAKISFTIVYNEEITKIVHDRRVTNSTRHEICIE
jgi:hypothetical protein